MASSTIELLSDKFWAFSDWEQFLEYWQLCLRLESAEEISWRAWSKWPSDDLWSVSYISLSILLKCTNVSKHEKRRGAWRAIIQQKYLSLIEFHVYANKHIQLRRMNMHLLVEITAIAVVSVQAELLRCRWLTGLINVELLLYCLVVVELLVVEGVWFLILVARLRERLVRCQTRLLAESVDGLALALAQRGAPWLSHSECLILCWELLHWFLCFY